MTTAFPALGTTAELLVTDPARLGAAVAVLREELAAIDAACSRFRPDSEISRLHEAAGREVRVGPLLAEALGVALRAARLTEGVVDPTVGAAVRALGYDRDFALVAGDRNAEGLGGADDRCTAAELSQERAEAADLYPASVPAPGWHRVLFDPVRRLVVLPRGVHLDLGATAKALAADRAARRIHATVGCGTLVNLGGDLRAFGPPPTGGWLVALGDDHTEAVSRPDATVALHRDGALATSGTTRRRWRHGGRTVHHIVDPRTGDVPEPRWRTVTVAAKSTVDANTASTAAIVLGAGAPRWLEQRHLPARLAGVDGDVVTTPGWPGEREAA
ncbi:thiamine biosynthesis lipoprotein [Amycolatopsis mediterranei S699]|uniref:FAD:protein FMN transferase n=2 Tax=Amycolatopsis mediterranei TaxID=33910 RepID=A0A0H3DC90_AMYMU|nr:FAD:protein FMN transferase [Amycolatopsis mediterranei]ADJ47683.1 thiamine biosynthesis lipoprotein [Amycolatopsis mediterranei U32]AEK44569.1 thiamine biosynthesis lipoprotein [Amycolatopsis mediterranei S699]AFO79394.1 thiamine biosynthesis lipoprotein [Amycolatopsis mediterranei S699]AGT86522.1 thiamine biosynthesis lipoprotein [Amycolatopsis mediterranei RB]KDO11863.1 thiamine biosynthesis protein [Amycolatopsis mediterranei]